MNVTERMYEVYCGNYDCPTRQAAMTHQVSDYDLGDDGAVWLCPQCRRKSEGDEDG